MRIFQTTLSLILLFAAAASAKIVFSSYQFPDSNIYVMDDNGNSITQITDYPDNDTKPRWSPDGQQIAFLRDTDPSDRARYRTFIMNADGTNVRQLTNQKEGRDERLAFSPDGKKLLISRGIDSGANAGLYVVDIKTTNITQISDIRLRDFDWSPNGKKIIFLKEEWWWEEHNLWMMNADGTDARPWIPLNKKMAPGNPRWSTNGQRILYTETDLRFEKGGAWVFNAGTYRYITRKADGSAPQTLDIPKDIMPGSVAWMNRGRSVLFSGIVDFDNRRDPIRYVQVYRYNLATKKIRQLTHDPGDKWNLDWVDGAQAISPAGKHPVQWGELKKTYSD